MVEYASITVDESNDEKLEQLQDELFEMLGFKPSKKELTELAIKRLTKFYVQEYDFDLDYKNTHPMDEELNSFSVGAGDEDES